MGETFLLILQMLIYWLCFAVLCLPKEYIRILFLPEKANFSMKFREAQKLLTFECGDNFFQDVFIDDD